MTVTNNIKAQVDLPVWEWCRALPVAISGALTSMTKLGDRYLYLQTAYNAIYRYDTWFDSWNQLTDSSDSSINSTNVFFDKEAGYYGGVIAGGASTVTIAGLSGKSLVGYKIKILSGTGAGQEALITDVADPVVVETGVASTINSSSIHGITDSSTAPGLKQWKVNLYNNYQFRVTNNGNGVSSNIIRKILYNNYNTLVFSTPRAVVWTPHWGAEAGPLAITAGALFQIESSVVTVDKPWNIPPDSTSTFVVKSGGIWIGGATNQGAQPFYHNGYYDILADQYYYKISNTMAQLNHLTAGRPCAAFNEDGGAILSGTATGGGANYIEDTGASWPVNAYANQMVKITGGTGNGQEETILGNSATRIYITKAFLTNPAALSTFSVFPDTDKLMFAANNSNNYNWFYQYSKKYDVFSSNRILEGGAVRTMSAGITGMEPLAISVIDKQATGIQVLNASPTNGGSGYLPDQILSIVDGGANGGTARILTVDTAGTVLTVALEYCGTGYSTGAGKVTSVNPAGGTNCTLNITTVGDVATVAMDSSVSHTFKLGDTVIIAGAVEAAYNGAKTIIGCKVGTGFQYVLAGAPTTPATYTALSSTVLVDASKNWSSGEHIGKYLMHHITSGYGYLSPNTSYFGRVTANTATTLTVATAFTAAPLNNNRYILIDPKVMGTTTPVVAGEIKGFATSGSATSLTDSSKSWPTNFWSSGGQRKARIKSGTGVGNELAITSNTATTLNYAAPGFTADTTTQYEIMDSYGRATGGSSTAVIDTTQNFRINSLVGMFVRTIFGTGSNFSCLGYGPITSNTATQINVASIGQTIDNTCSYAVIEPQRFGAGCFMVWPYGTTNTSIGRNYIYIWNGGTTRSAYRYNLTKDLVENISYVTGFETLASGTMYAYDGVDRVYFTKDATGRVMYYDFLTGLVNNAGQVPYGMSTAMQGNRMEIITTADGLKYLYIVRHTGQEMWRMLLAY